MGLGLCLLTMVVLTDPSTHKWFKSPSMTSLSRKGSRCGLNDEADSLTYSSVLRVFRGVRDFTRRYFLK